jgi:hypothetical protein
LFIIISIGSSSGNEYDLSEINYKVWSKKNLTFSFVDHPTYLNPNNKNILYYEFLGAFRAWETISHFQFNPYSTKADIVINFTSK